MRSDTAVLHSLCALFVLLASSCVPTCDAASGGSSSKVNYTAEDFEEWEVGVIIGGGVLGTFLCAAGALLAGWFWQKHFSGDAGAKEETSSGSDYSYDGEEDGEQMAGVFEASPTIQTHNMVSTLSPQHIKTL